MIQKSHSTCRRNVTIRPDWANVHTLLLWDLKASLPIAPLIAFQVIALRHQFLLSLCFLVSSPVGSYSVCFANLCTQMVMTDQK